MTNVRGSLIEDVLIGDLVTNTDVRGFFREIVRVDKVSPTQIAQLSHSMVNEGTIKGWHGHLNQTQWNYIVRGVLKVVLIDQRSNSPTFGNIMSFIAGESAEICYVFSPGILHGYECLKGPADIIYGTSEHYDLNKEIRVPIDDISQPYIRSK